jgi:hypothetical protein
MEKLNKGQRTVLIAGFSVVLFFALGLIFYSSTKSNTEKLRFGRKFLYNHIKNILVVNRKKIFF